MMAESKALRRFVARKNMDFFARRRSLIAVSILVVSSRDSMARPGVSRSKQNSSISSKSYDRIELVSETLGVSASWTYDDTLVQGLQSFKDVSNTRRDILQTVL